MVSSFLLWLAFQTATQPVKPAGTAGPEVSFSLEVMAVLSRAGCNSGPCHGNLNGKGGLKLSLRGEDPAFDYRVLTRELNGRRINRIHPDESLLLIKAVGALPHEGGRRFSQSSGEYALLKTWIAQGCPPPLRRDPLLGAKLRLEPEELVISWAQPLGKLRAYLETPGQPTREVTSLIAWETTSLNLAVDRDGLVTPGPLAKPGQVAEGAVVARLLDRQVVSRVAMVGTRNSSLTLVPPSHPIDRQLFPRIEKLGLEPSPIIGDAVFLRRLYLDLLGVLPTPAEARAFLDDGRSDKRERLVDQLLERPEFADYWALKWADLLRVEEKTLDAAGVRAIHGWLRTAFAQDRPLNEIARDLVASRGSTYSEPPANFYRALRDPDTRAEAVAQVFLGIRIGCAKCHNHPFDRWKQDDYHGLAAALAPIDYQVLNNARKDNLDKHEFVGEQIVYLKRDQSYKHPVTRNPMKPAFLGQPVSGPLDAPTQLAEWIAQPENPWFARAQANRIWRHMIGKGLVDPEDDFRITNPASRPELLDFLASRLRENHFSVRSLVRLIATSQAYQRSVAIPVTGPEETQTSQGMLKPLGAEQLLDALTAATGSVVRFEGYPRGTRSGQLPGVTASAKARPGRAGTGTEVDRFLKTFGKPDRLLSCDCERTEETTLGQSLQLLAGPLVQQLLSDPQNRIGKLMEARLGEESIFEELWLATLSRRPTPQEIAGARALLERASDRRQALEDLQWGLIVSREFLLRH